MSYLLPSISNEQSNIIKSLENNNIIVDSVAGSGKTTTILYITKANPNKNILLLTYNSKLKLETRNRVKNLNLKNIEVHSYHSYCVKYYDNHCITDSKIREIINTESVFIKLPKNYDIIILDEAQDITPLYFELICKIIKDLNYNTKICIFGDQNQSIYGFNKADERYIIYGDKLFNFNQLTWKKEYLKESFRITNKMAEFINNCMLDYDRIISNKKSNVLVRYIICDCINKQKSLIIMNIFH
jgi:superfamily I DNA/RNA helicase